MPEHFDEPDFEENKEEASTPREDEQSEPQFKEVTDVFDEDETYQPVPLDEVPHVFINEDIHSFDELDRGQRTAVPEDQPEAEIPFELRLKAIDYINSELFKEGGSEMEYTGLPYFTPEQTQARVDEVMLGESDERKTTATRFFNNIITFANSPIIRSNFEDESLREEWEDSLVERSSSQDWALVNAVSSELLRNKLNHDNLVTLNQNLGIGIDLFKGDEQMGNQMKDLQLKIRILVNDKNFETSQDKWASVEELSAEIDAFLSNFGFIHVPKTPSAEDRS